MQNRDSSSTCTLFLCSINNTCKKNKALQLDFDFSLVPEEYHKIVKCAHIFSTSEFENDGQILDCVICTNIGHILEFRKKRLIDSCELSNKDPQKVKPMLTYDRNIGMLYVVQLPNHQVEIISRVPRLKSVRVEQDAVEWEVADAARLGYPQLRVKGGDGSWRRVPVTEERQMLSDGLKEMSVPLETTLQNLRAKLQRSRDLLVEKRELRSRTMAAMMADQSAVVVPVTVLACDYALHHGRTILVVRLRHTSRTPVTDLRLMVTGADTLRLHQAGAPPVLDEGNNACLVGALLSCNPSPKVAVALTCKSGSKEHFVSLPPPPSINPLSEEMKLEKLGPAELCSALTHCSGESLHLRLGCGEGLRAHSWGLLQRGLPGLMTLVREGRDRSVWCSQQGGELAGSYLITETTRQSVVACCRDLPQLGLLRLALSSLLPEDCPLLSCDEDAPSVEPKDTTSGLAALRHELDWLCQHSRLSAGPIPSEQYRAFYQELASRSSATDSHFSTS